MHGLSNRQLLLFLLQFTVLLGTARALGGVAQRFGQAGVMGEVVAGVLLGPAVLAAALPAMEAFLFPDDRRQTGFLEHFTSSVSPF